MDKLKRNPLCTISCKGALFLKFLKNMLKYWWQYPLKWLVKAFTKSFSTSKGNCIDRGPANFHSLKKLWSKIKSSLEYCTFIFQSCRAAMQFNHFSARDNHLLFRSIATLPTFSTCPSVTATMSYTYYHQKSAKKAWQNLGKFPYILLAVINVKAWLYLFGFVSLH